MIVGLVIVNKTHHVGCITQYIVNLVNIHAVGIIDSLGGMLLNGILLGAVGHIVGLPPVHGYITSRLQAIAKESVIGAESGVDALKVGTLHDAVMIEPA